MPGDPRRDARVRQVLAASGLAAVICRLPDNVVCLADYYPQVGLSFVVYPAEGEPIVIAPRPERELAAAGLVSDVRTFETWRLIDPSPLEVIGRLLGQVVAEKKLAGKPVGYE